MAMQQLDEFLASSEKKAFRMARFAVGNDADALDIVQDAMMKLVENYRDRAAEQWPPLFYRILQNRIMDFHRGKKWSWLFSKSANDEDYVLDSVEDSTEKPADWLSAERMSADLLAEIEKLPMKQQQCFLLRGWEGLSVKDTAEAMSITEGSVKQHYSRALAKLSGVLEQYDD